MPKIFSVVTVHFSPTVLPLAYLVTTVTLYWTPGWSWMFSSSLRAASMSVRLWRPLPLQTSPDPPLPAHSPPASVVLGPEADGVLGPPAGGPARLRLLKPAERMFVCLFIQARGDLTESGDRTTSNVSSGSGNTSWRGDCSVQWKCKIH